MSKYYKIVFKHNVIYTRLVKEATKHYEDGCNVFVMANNKWAEYKG